MSESQNGFEKSAKATKLTGITELPFDKQVIKSGVAPNLISALLIFIFATIFISLRPAQLPWAILVVGAIVLFAEFVFSPLTNGILTKKLTADIARWKAGEIDGYKERTVLYERIMRFPIKKAFQTFLYFFVCATLMAVGYYIVPQIGLNLETNIYSYAACLFGSYFAGLLAFDYSERLCVPIAEKLVEQGVDEAYVREHKMFGLTLTYRAVLFLAVPTVWVGLLSTIVIREGYTVLNGHTPDAMEQIIKMALVSVINLVLSLILVSKYYQNIKHTSDLLTESLMHSLTTYDANQYMQTCIGDQIQYNVFLLNTVVRQFKTLIDTADVVAEKVLHTTDSLSVISGELSSTSLEQSAAVKEILTTMEDSSALSKNISNTVGVISRDSETIYQAVSASFQVLTQITAQMAEIDTANGSIMEGIKELETEVANIGQVISIITDIADQTRIIAFNAELEAVSAGDEGQSFHIVATEIRRLAGSTLNSITEIKEYIENIQNAANRLIASSQTGTNFIHEEMGLTHQLEEQFEGIKELSDVTASESGEITEIVGQQDASFNQIVVTLRQISASVDGFASMTRTINDTAVSMQDFAQALADLEKVIV